MSEENQQESASFLEVIKHRGFLNLWINQILVQLSYNSVNFALIIWVFRLTNSNVAVSALLFAVYLPAVILGPFAGVLIDVTDRKKVIRILNLLLIVSYLSLVVLKDSYPAILIVAFLINALGQFYIPAESSAIPLIVQKRQLLTANSLFSITLFSAFLIGFGMSGPLVHNLGINFLFEMCGFFLFLAFLLTFAFPSIISREDEQGRKLIGALKRFDLQDVKSVVWYEIYGTIKLIRGRLPVLVSLFILAGVQVVIGVLAVLIPSFFESNLQINATDASYILIVPLGIGMVLGGIIMGRFGYKLPKRSIVGTAILIAGLLLFSVGAAPLVSPVIQHFPKPRPLPFTYQPSLSTILTVGSFLLGMAMVSVVVPSQTVLQENTPEEGRGKVFALLGVLMSALTLIPVLLVGFLADFFGTMPIFIAIGGTVGLIGLMAIKPDFYFDKHHLPFKVREFLGMGHWNGKA